MKNKKVLTISVSVILAVVIALGAIVLLALKDPNKDKYQAEPSTKLLQNIILSTVKNEELAISQDELNGVLAYRLKKEYSDGAVNGVYFDLNDVKDDKVKVYIPITYKSVDLGISAYVKPSLDKEHNIFCFEIFDSKLGMLPIPSSLVADYMGDSEPDMFKSDGNKLLMNLYIKCDINSTSVKITIDEFRIENGQVIIKTSGLLNTIADILKGLILGNE